MDRRPPYPLNKASFPPTIRKQVYTRETAVQLLQIAERETHTHPIIYISRLLVRHLQKRHPISEANAILYYVRQHIRYQHDPDGIEVVFGPAEMIRMIQQYGRFSEDCDSQAALVYSLLRAIGHRVRFSCWNFTGSDKIDHISVEDFIGDRWFILDPILEPPEVPLMLKFVKWKETFSINRFSKL
jgi:hypothetical protein